MPNNLKNTALNHSPDNSSEFKRITEACPDGVLVVGQDGRVVFANAAAGELLDRPVDELVGGVFGYPVMTPDRTELEIGDRHVEIRVVPADWDGRPAYLASLRDMTDRVQAAADLKDLTVALEEANQQLRRLATVDPLTETLNRRGIENAFFNELSRERRSGANLVAVLLSGEELDDIIEHIGQAGADVVLKAAADRLKSALRPSDQIARIDRHRFLVLLPDTRKAEGSQVAEKLRFAVGSTPLAVSPRSLSLDMKVAVVKVPPETCSIEEILELARHSLRSGPQRVTPARPVPVAPKVPNLLDLQSAIEKNSFRAVSQPIIDLEAERIVGHELLTRGPVGAIEMPVDFFRVALEANMLTTVDLSCLKACVDLSKRLRPRGKLHLNLLPSTILGTPSERLMDLLTTDDDVSFCIEISEQQFIGDPACLRDHVTAFKERGIEVSIDDVGFGRSCLETLIMLEPDVVKIDRAYVDRASKDPHKGRLLSRLVQVSRALGAEIVAEGIETRDDLALLRDYGVRYGQGWLWGKPGASEGVYLAAS